VPAHSHWPASPRGGRYILTNSHVCPNFYSRAARAWSRRRLHRHHLHPGPRVRGEGTMPQGSRSTPAQTAQVCCGDERNRGRRADRHGLPAAHRTKSHSTNSLERLNGKVKRRTDVADIFPYEAIYRLVAAILLDQNDEWSIQRDMTLETIATLSDDATVSACPPWQTDIIGQTARERNEAVCSTPRGRPGFCRCYPSPSRLVLAATAAGNQSNRWHH
jgi:Transposase, Mutator family